MSTTDDIPTTEKSQDDKIVILFKATGNAPILKKNKFKISASFSFQEVILFLRDKVLKLKASDSLFLYCNAAFCPSPDDIVGQLYEHFSSDKMLVINYCTQPAYG
jgi:ubiquitin-like protein ATG12